MNVVSNFTNRLDPVRQLINLDRTWDDPNTGLTLPQYRPIAHAVRLAVIFLPVAFFEDYIRELMNVFISELNSQQPSLTWSKLPIQIRKTHVFDSETHVRRDPERGTYDAHEQLSLTRLSTLITKLTSPYSTPAAYEIISEPFEGTNANPNSKQIGKMFNRIGIENAFEQPKLLTELQQYDPKFSQAQVVRRQLDDIIELRHDVAHGRSISNISRTDLEQNVLFLEQLGTCLNKLADDHLQQVIAAAT